MLIMKVLRAKRRICAWSLEGVTSFPRGYGIEEPPKIREVIERAQDQVIGDEEITPIDGVLRIFPISSSSRRL